MPESLFSTGAKRRRQVGGEERKRVRSVKKRREKCLESSSELLDSAQLAGLYEKSKKIKIASDGEEELLKSSSLSV